MCKMLHACRGSGWQQLLIHTACGRLHPRPCNGSPLPFRSTFPPSSLQFERRMALRVERDAAVEAATRKAEAPGLNGTPEFLEGVGSLKDYQVEGEGRPTGGGEGNACWCGGMGRLPATLPSPFCRRPGVCQLLLAVSSALHSARRNR